MKIINERWRLEHISYRRWCEMARAEGWKGEDDADGDVMECAA